MKQLVVLFTLLLTFLTFTLSVDAATVIQKSGTQFGTPTVANGIVKTSLSGTVKYIRHAKYTDAAMTQMSAQKQMSAGGGTIKAFAYNCPGYYLTRIYSDAKGTTLIGVMKMYVANGEVGDSKCESITPPANNAAPPVNDTKINVTHPNPTKTETNNMVVPSTVTPTAPVTGLEKDPEPVKPKPPATTEERVKACQDTSLGSEFYAVVKQASTGYYACVDMEYCSPSHAHNGELRWYCYDDNVTETIYVNKTLPWEVEPEADPQSRNTYPEDQCGIEGDDLCAVTMHPVTASGTNCPECGYEPRRWWQPLRAYAARRE